MNATWDEIGALPFAVGLEQEEVWTLTLPSIVSFILTSWPKTMSHVILCPEKLAVMSRTTDLACRAGPGITCCPQLPGLLGTQYLAYTTLDMEQMFIHWNIWTGITSWMWEGPMLSQAGTYIHGWPAMEKFGLQHTQRECELIHCSRHTVVIPLHLYIYKLFAAMLRLQILYVWY